MHRKHWRFVRCSCFSNQTTDPNQLVKENPVTKNIVNDEVHTYTVKLEKGLFVSLAVEQTMWILSPKFLRRTDNSSANSTRRRVDAELKK